MRAQDVVFFFEGRDLDVLSLFWYLVLCELLGALFMSWIHHDGAGDEGELLLVYRMARVTISRLLHHDDLLWRQVPGQILDEVPV